MTIEAYPQSHDAGIQYDHVKKRHTVSKLQWNTLQKAEVIPPVNNKFFPEYGVLFRDHGYLLSGLKKAFLFVTVDIQKRDTSRRCILTYQNVTNGQNGILEAGKVLKEMYQILWN